MTVAHEMWIEPIKFSVKTGDNIYAHEKVGQDFKGNMYAYLATSYEKFELSIGNNTRPIKSRLGDIPTVKERVEDEGLAILFAITTASVVSYENWGKFEKFIKNKKLEWVFAKHKQRGIPHKDFKEVYRRYAKSLIKVGHGKGNDRFMKMPFEWIAETNPYTNDSEIKLRLLWQGKPFSGAQVSIFNRVKTNSSETELIKSHLTTDSQGRVTIPRGKGRFLINAVQMIQPSVMTAKETAAVWESLWASLTYEIPLKK